MFSLAQPCPVGKASIALNSLPQQRPLSLRRPNLMEDIVSWLKTTSKLFFWLIWPSTSSSCQQYLFMIAQHIQSSGLPTEPGVPHIQETLLIMFLLVLLKKSTVSVMKLIWISFHINTDWHLKKPIFLYAKYVKRNYTKHNLFAFSLFPKWSSPEL